MLLFVTAVTVVLVVSFLCSVFESVLLSLTRSQIEVVGQKRKGAGRLLSGFKDNMDGPIAAILILNTAAHTIGAAVAGASYSNVFSASTLWIFSLIFTVAVLLMTEIIPKTLGITHAPALAAPVAYGIHWLTVLLRPLVAVSERISRAIRGDINVPVTSTEELRMLAALGRSAGAVGESTAEIIVGATQLRHLQARDVMLPRTEVRFMSGTMSREEVLKLTRESGHSRFPFTPTDSLLDVSGIVLAKDLLYWLLQNDGHDIDWNKLVKEPLIIPESVALPQLMRGFQEGHKHMAIIVSEYGAVEGVATMEDVLEEIVGDIRDESDVPADDFELQEDGSVLVNGRVDLRKLADHLGITWNPDENVSTIGGLITESLERIPVAGDSMEWQGHKVTVHKADRRQVKLVKVSKL